MKNSKFEEPPSKDDLVHFHDVFKPEDSITASQVNNSLHISNHLQVFKSIHQTLETNSDIVSLIPGFFEAREIFKGFVNKLSGKYSKIKENLVGLLLKIAGALRSYGVMTDNAELIASSNLKDSCIKNFNDSEIIHRADTLLKNARLYISTLNYFGISYESLTDFETMIGKFSYATGQQSENLLYSPEWKDELDRDFDEAYAFIQNTLDNYLEKAKEHFPKFYSEYNNAKTLLNLKNIS